MPIYEFRCVECGRRIERIRAMGDTDPPGRCTHSACGGVFEHILSVPTMHVWNKDRRFPNVTPKGDGSMSFETKQDYEVHLKESHQVEVAHDGLKKHKPGSEVITYG